MFAAPIMADESPAPASSQVSDGAVNWDNIETVIVHPPVAGPAMWHVQLGDSEIWLIGTISLMPKHLTWNDSGIARVLSGARKLYTAPEPDTGTVSMLWFLATHDFSLPDGQHVQDFLDAADQSRLTQDMADAGAKSGDYDGVLPQVAGLELLIQTAAKHHWLQDSDQLVGAHMTDMADDRDVDTDSLGSFAVMDLLRQSVALSPKVAAPCLAAAMDDVERWQSHVAPEADAWAVGDVSAMKANFTPDHFQLCLKKRLPLWDKADRDTDALLRKAVRKALKKPGKTVMLLPVEDLLADDGVLKLLSDMGLTVELVSAP